MKTFPGGYSECQSDRSIDRSSIWWTRYVNLGWGFITPFAKILLGNLWGQNGISFQPTQEENVICNLGMIIYIGALEFTKEANGSLKSLRKYYKSHTEVGMAETSRNITARVIQCDVNGPLHKSLEESRGFRTRQHGR
ncbi:hypothetical protein TNCV_2014171 [Trichonephila clavipes]|nr:hypothetical protein TNCV_2014171 [Trichonephila clavipes]